MRLRRHGNTCMRKKYNDKFTNEDDKYNDKFTNEDDKSENSHHEDEPYDGGQPTMFNEAAWNIKQKKEYEDANDERQRTLLMGKI